MNIWRAAGSDYQLALLTHNLNPYPPDTEREKPFTGQTSIFNKFKEPTEGVKAGSEGLHESGTYMADQSTTINDMFKRYVETVIRSPQTYPSDWNTSFDNFTPIGLFSCSFLFWRGSRRFKITTEDSYARILIPGITDATPRQGSAIVLPNTDRIQVTVPWYSTELAYTTAIGRNNYAPQNVNMPPDILWTGTLGDNDHVYLAAGDDFTYLYLVPPNPGFFSPPSKLITEGPSVKESKTTSLTGNSSNHTCTFN
jgi:hypothetical protein